MRRLLRLADRYALIFLPVTLALAFVAWLISVDLIRSLAVFAAATPCPMILAAPVAFIAGRPGGPARHPGEGRRAWKRLRAPIPCCSTRPGAISFATPSGSSRRLRPWCACIRHRKKIFMKPLWRRPRFDSTGTEAV